MNTSLLSPVALERLTALPSHTAHDLFAYILHGQGVGSFLTAVLVNDLFKAYAHADSMNADALGDIVRWLYNWAPVAAYGSESAIVEWQRSGGLEGQHKARTTTTTATNETQL